jgi:hypothetical protein
MVFKIGQPVKAQTKYGWMSGHIKNNKMPYSYMVEAPNGKEYNFRKQKVFPDNTETARLILLEKLKREAEKELDK